MVDQQDNSKPQVTDAASADHEEAIVPIRPRLADRTTPEASGAPGVAKPAAQASNQGAHRRALGALAVLLLLALAVVFLLPRWVEEPDVSESEPIPTAQPEPELPAVPQLDPAVLRELEAAAEQLLARLLTQQGDLEAMSSERWGGEDWQRYVELARLGDDAFLAKAFDQALDQYQQALDLGEALAATAGNILTATLDAGLVALAAGNPSKAAEQFELALAIDSNNSQALEGDERARNLPQVLALMEAGREAEAEGRLSEAADKFRQALQLDGNWDQARDALRAVGSRLQGARFANAMSAGLSALGEKDFDAAAEAFQRALDLRPGAQEAVDGLTQADQGKRLNRIALARVRATAFERQERWDEAIAQYKTALALDGSVSFAQEGVARAEARASLEKKLVNLIERPRLLFSDEVLADAQVLLADARSISEPGPKHKDQATTLGRLVNQALTPIQVRLFSDNLTDVTVYRVGQLGVFDVKDLDLRPGRYTVVGSRDGYRDVREILEILPGTVPQPLTVQCVDRI